MRQEDGGKNTARVINKHASMFTEAATSRRKNRRVLHSFVATSEILAFSSVKCISRIVLRDIYIC